MSDVSCDILNPVDALLADYVQPSPLGFGAALAPVMYCAQYREGDWQTGEVVPFGNISVNPAATCLQFGQQCFEGMKAYGVNQPKPQLFRPELNYARFARSAARVCMPVPPAEIFAAGLSALIGMFEPHLPSGTGQSLYLRPTLLGTGPTFQVTPSSEYKFIIIASPSEAYFSKPINVMIERTQTRAVRGGTGMEKVGGNYAASLQATAKSVSAGFDQPLWLDAVQQQNIEELSGMNVFAVVEGELHTPALNGSILAGITRQTLLDIGKALGMTVREIEMPIERLLANIQQGRCSELFACGTAAIVSPIAMIGEHKGDTYALPEVNNVAATLKKALLDVQEGRAEDTFNWMVNAADVSQLIDRCLLSRIE